MKVIVAGSRSIRSAAVVNAAIIGSGLEIRELVSGTAPGVDRLGERWAASRGIPVKRFPADWSRLGRRGGPLRNEEMACYADALIAVWDGRSPGTADMIWRAYAHGRLVFIHEHSPQTWDPSVGRDEP
jgi:hypothetical protein